MTLRLTNPHSVLAALETRPADVVEVCLPARGAGPAWQRVAELAESAGCPVKRVERAPDRGGDDDDRRRPGRGGRGQGQRRGPQHRGRDGGRDGGRGQRESGPRGGSKSGSPREGRSSDTHALVLPREALEPEDVFIGITDAAGTDTEGKPGPGLWLALDCLQDPRNVGAVFRSAAFFGVRGVLLTKDRSAPLTAVSYDTASGGLEHVPFAEATNLVRALDLAKERGLWILGAAEEARQDVADVDRGRPWLLVVGNEESGLRRLTRERCDDLCRVSSHGPIDSLNVSVASAVLMATLSRPVG